MAAFRRSGDARSIPRIRIPGEHARDRSVLVGKLAEILRDQRPTRKVTAMFIEEEFAGRGRLMGTLPKEQTTAFEDHCVGCARCATVLQGTAEYVDAMRAVARKQRWEPPNRMK